MGTRTKIGIGLFVFFLIFIVYISGLLELGKTVIAIALYSFIAYGFYFLWKKIRKKETLLYKIFLLKFISSIGYSIFLLLSIVGGFAYYQNEVSPAKMPTYFLTNGEKQVIFQSMSHIGTINFYNGVIEKIKEAKSNNYVLYYEGVRPGTEENTDKFDKAIGVKFDKELYKNFSKLYGVINQNNDDLLGLINNEDYNIDLSIDEIIEIYESKYSIESDKKEIIDASKEINRILAMLNEKQLKILVYINQAILNTIIKADNLRENMLKLTGTSNIFDVILNDRNNFLVKNILESKDKKIIIIYGLMHYEGIFELLKESDNNWRLEKVEYLYPIK